MREFAVALLIGVYATGCGTTLNISEHVRGAKDPDGVVVNRRHVYKATVQVRIPGHRDQDTSATVDGLHRDILAINISRMPFADGDLVLKLDDKQRLTKLEIKSTGGAEDAAKGAKAVLEARKAIREDDEDE